MGVLARRRHATLVLLVGLLGAAAVVAATLGAGALQTPLGTTLTGVLRPAQTGLPTRIDVGPGQATRNAAPVTSPAAPGSVTVVTPPVYSYPDDHGGDRARGSGSGRGGPEVSPHG